MEKTILDRKATTISKALHRWEKEHGQSAAEGTDIRLIMEVPLIE